MSQSQDEGRAARIQKYKEERRIQLTAKTATLFSANVTERRPRKILRVTSEDPAAHLKSSSELNLNTASTSVPVPIRTTRTSRLRAAAANNIDSSPSPRKTNRSSSVQSLLEDDKTKTPKSSKIIDRDKAKSTRRQNHEKENLLKRPPATYHKEIGAQKSKPKHSIVKNCVEKDKCNILVDSPKGKFVDESIGSKLKENNPIIADKKENGKNFEKDVMHIYVNGEDIFNQAIENDDLNGKKVDDLFNDLVIEDEKPKDVVNDIILDVDLINDTGLKHSHKANIPANNEAGAVKDKDVDVDNSVVPIDVNVEMGGLLGAACVRKVERFSELLSNLCSPYEADTLFQDVLVDNGIDGSGEARPSAPECTPPCRRTQPTRATTSTPKRGSGSSSDATGTVSKTKGRRPYEAPHTKTESSLPSSKSPKSTFNLSFGIKPSHKSSTSTTISPQKNERRRSSDTGAKPSCIPLSKKSVEKQRNSASPVKQDLTKDAPKLDKLKLETGKVKHIRRSPEKGKSDTECNRIDTRHRAQKDSENLSEKYHYSKKRLTSLDNSPKEISDAKNSTTTKSIANDILKATSQSLHVNHLNAIDSASMSTLHEPVIPHTSGSRLSQEMDNLAALTKQTLDRVNKLSNNLNSNKLNVEVSQPRYETLFPSTSEQKTTFNYPINNDKHIQNRGVTERLRDIDTAAQRLIDFEKSAMFSDLTNDTSSQNRRLEQSSTTCSLTPVSILKRKSIHDDSAISNTPNQNITSPPVTFSLSVIETNGRPENRQRQGILKKRRSLDESQVARRRSCSPEVSFADDGSILDNNKPILKNRRSSLEDVIRTSDSPEGQIQGILKRKMSREEELLSDDLSHGSPEPHGILKRKSNSSSSSSTTSSHVSIAQAVLLAAAGGAEIVDEDKELVRPILKKKSFSEERPCLDITPLDTPRPILKKKSMEHDDYDFELPKRPILKSSKKHSGDEGHTSSFDLSEEDRSSRRTSLLRSRTSDHSGSECETNVRPILKQRGSSLTRERSQSPRPRLSFCADNEANISVTNFSTDANDLSAAGSRRVLNLAPDPEESYPSAVLRRRNLRPKSNARSKSLACDVNDELLSILNNRRLKVDNNCDNANRDLWESENQKENEDEKPKTFPSIASRIKSMEQALIKDQSSSSRSKRDKERYKTQPITVEEIRSVASSLEPGQASFQAYGSAGSSFPSGPDEYGAASKGPFPGEPERDSFAVYAKTLGFPPFGEPSFAANSLAVNGQDEAVAKDDCVGEATFLDFQNIDINGERRRSTLDEIEQEVNKVRVALDEDCRALEEDERQQAEADNWSLNVSCDSGVYNRASSRDSGPHSGEELGLIESQEIRDNQATNSSSNEWSSSSIERGLLAMDRERKSTENEMVRSDDQSDEEERGLGAEAFGLGLVKSNSVVARASMWQQLQQQARGTPKPLLRHNRSKAKEGPSVAERFKTQPISFPPAEPEPEPVRESFSLAQSKSTANVLDRDDDAKLDEDDPAKLSLADKMRMFNTKLTHKPPPAGLPRPKEDRQRTRLKTMPVLSSQVQEALDQNERLTKSLTHENVPRNPDFQLKMELFRSASAKNASLEYMMRQNAKFRSLDLDDDAPTERAQRMITPEVRGILKSGTTVVPTKHNTLAKGESSEGLKDEGIDSSSDESVSASTVSSSEKSCSSSDSSDEAPQAPEPKPRRFQRKVNKLKASRTDSDLTRLHDPPPFLKKLPGGKIQLPCANELKERLNQAKNPEVKIPMLGKLGRKPSEDKKDDDENGMKYRRFAKKLDEPIQLGKLRRSTERQPEEKPLTILKISSLNQEAKNKFFGIEPKREKTVDELAAAVRRYIPPVSKCMSTQMIEFAGSGSDGESSGGREVRQINTRGRRLGGGVQRSATHAEMPHRGNTIAERLAALQAAGTNDWRARVCRLSPEQDDSKAIERAKNMINESLNAGVDDRKKVHIDETELSSNILTDRRNKLETAAQGWRKRVPQNDATLFTVAGRLERDKVATTPPQAPAPLATTPSLTAVTASPGVPQANKFRSRKQHSPTNGFGSGPLRSASCAIVSAAEIKPKETPKIDRESFKRSHSVSESISAKTDEKVESSPGAERTGVLVRIPRADDETFHAFYTPAIQRGEAPPSADVDVDLDAIDSAERQLLSNDIARRAKRDRRHAASRNPLRALQARSDIRDQYVATTHTTIRDQLIKEKATANCGLAAEALAALASKEDFSNVALRSASSGCVPCHGVKTLMLLQVKGRRRVQTRLVEPIHKNVNRGDCFVLVTPDQLFLYIGHYANVIERNRSTDIANHILNTKDLGCKNCTGIIKLDEHSKNYSNKHWNQFWSLLGVTEGIENYRPIETGHADEDDIYESCIIQTNMCYEVIDDELVPIKEYWGQMPKIAMLHQSKVIVFDFGSEMYIWYGKNVPLESRRRAAQLAQELFDEGYNYAECHINPLNAASYQGLRNEVNDTKSAKSRPEWAVLSKVTQHMETILFKEKFLDWPDYSRVIKVKHQENRSNSTEIQPIDVEEMLSNEYQDPDLILEGSHIGRGTHYYDKEAMKHYEIKTKSVTKWLIRENDYVKVTDDSRISEFYSGDSYIIRWGYQITVTGRELTGQPSKHNLTGRDRCAYFCWQGKDASSNEKGTAALLTVELDQEKGAQVRVAQGTEPPAFLNLFQGNLVIQQGKKDTDKSRYKLFVARGNVANEAYLLQVPCSIRQVRTRGSLLLVDTEKGVVYVWLGARSMKHTKAVALELANRLVTKNASYLFGPHVSPQIVETKEGEESKELLEALGVANKQHYNSVLTPCPVGEGTPRLFHMSDLRGQFEAIEILSPFRHPALPTPFPFQQKDLYGVSQPALFLLDDGACVWLWQGWWPRGEDGEIELADRNAGTGAFAARWQAMRAAALRCADEYERCARARARGDVRVVAAGLEPDAFCRLFDTWQECDDAADANISHGYKAGESLSGWCELSRLTCKDAVLPLAELQRRPLPPHVDPQFLERHLSTPDFTEAFGMTKEEFSVLPSWRQTNMKKDVGLF